MTKQHLRSQRGALRVIESEGGEIWMGMPTRGHYTVSCASLDGVIPPSVWERLVDLGDLDIEDRGGSSDKWLVLTSQGRARLHMNAWKP